MSLTEYYEGYAEERNKVILNREKKTPLGGKEKIRKIMGHFKSPILDVGCATGEDTNYFKEKGFEVDGCDISVFAITEAKKRFPRTSFFQHDMTQEPTAKKYNTVYAFDIIEHVFNYHSFLKNINESLNDKGIIALTTPNINGLKTRIALMFGNGTYFINPKDKEQAHIRFFSVKTIKELMELHGFKAISLTSSIRGTITYIGEKTK